MKRTGWLFAALLVATMVVAAGGCGGSDDAKSGSGGASSSASSASSASSSSKPKVYGAGDSITVKHGDTFVIALDANPSTGYSWQAMPDVNVQFVSSKQVQGKSNAVGAPGTQQLTFTAVQTGSSTLTLNYLRPFDPPSTPPAQTQTFPVTVT